MAESWMAGYEPCYECAVLTAERDIALADRDRARAALHEVTASFQALAAARGNVPRDVFLEMREKHDQLLARGSEVHGGH